MKNIAAHTFTYGWTVNFMAPIFLVLFMLIILFVFHRSAKASQEETERLPLDDGEPVNREQK